MVCSGPNCGRFVCTGLYFFFTGVEYAVILPTLNGYLISLDAPNGFLGVVFAAFSFTGLLSAPVFGRITDKTGSTKLCVIASNVFEVAGNFWYFASKDFKSVLAARLVAGIGSGAGSSVLGMLSRTTTENERTAVFSIVMALRQVGLLIGPALNVFMNDLNIEMGPFVLNQYTGPGFMMAGIWTLHIFIMLMFFKDTEKGEMVENTMSDNNVTTKVRSGHSSPKQNKGFRSLVNELMCEEVIVLLAMTFMVMFTQTGIETAVTPMTLLFFQWGSLYNSYLFCGVGVLVTLIFIITGYLSKYASDRAMILFGCFSLIIGYLFLFLLTLAFRSQNELEPPSWLFPLWIVSIFILVLGLAISWVPQATLFSKLTSMETQAFNQGIRLVAMGVGQILGPIWASSTSTKNMFPIMSAVYFLLLCILTTMLCMSYKLLSPPVKLPNDYISSGPFDKSYKNENSSLLSI